MWVKACTHMRADANRAAVAAAGGIEVVVAVLRRHEGNAAVAEQACRALIDVAILGECACVEQLHTCWRCVSLRCDCFEWSLCVVGGGSHAHVCRGE